MTTTVIKTIGSAGGRDYATVSAFLAAIPADLVAADQAWIGELYNDSEFVVTTKITLGAKTTSAACYIMLRPATGQGFADHASKLTNALRYNPANGVALTSSMDWDDVIDLSGANDVIVEGLQFKFTAGFWSNGVKFNGLRSELRGCLFDLGTRGKPFVFCESGEKVFNNVAIYTGGLERATYLGWNTAKAYNNTIFVANPGGSATEGYSSTEFKNNLLIGVADAGPIPAIGCQYNAVTAAAFAGSNNLTSINAADTVVSTTAGALDMRVKAGASVIGAGANLAIATDILEQARTVATPTIGAHEYVVAGGGAAAPGATLIGAGTLAAGTASGSSPGAAPGATLSGSSTLSPGSATGGSGTGGFVSDVMENNSGAGLLANTAVSWTWWQGSIGAAPASLTHGAGMTNAGGVLTLAGLPLGAGFLIGRTADGTGVYYQPGVVA